LKHSALTLSAQGDHAMDDEFHVSANPNRAGVLVVTVSGELDTATRDRLTSAVAASAKGARECVIDLSGVTFIDAGGIRGLLTCQRHIHHPGATVTLVGVGGEVGRVLRLAGVDEVLR
jgi:anti-anti-sigma factor